MHIERIFTRPLPVPAADQLDVARSIAAGLVPSAVLNRQRLNQGIHSLSESFTIREEIEILDDLSGVYRLLPSKSRMKMAEQDGVRARSYHMPHDRTILVLRGSGSTPDGNITGVLVCRNDVNG